MVQLLRLCTPNAGDLGSTPGQETRSHMLQLRVHMLQQKSKIPNTAAKTQHSQINKYFLKNRVEKLRGHCSKEKFCFMNCFMFVRMPMCVLIVV